MFFRVISYLLLITVLTTVVTGVVTYNQMTKDGKARAESYLVNELNALYEKYDSAKEAADVLTHLNDENMLARARSVAMHIKDTPSLLTDTTALLSLCNKLKATSIIVCDADGNVITSAPTVRMKTSSILTTRAQNRGGTSETSPLKRTIQELATSQFERTMLAPAHDNPARQERYACVRREDTDGVIVVSFRMEREGSARKMSDVADLVDNASVGEKGTLVAFEGGQPYVSEGADLPATEAELRALQLDTLQEEIYHGTPYFVYVMKRGNLRLIAMVPTSEYYSSRLQSTMFRVYSGLVLVLALFFTAYALMRRYTLKPLEQLEASMRSISRGNYDERVHLTATPEFRKLAQSINIMLDSIRNSNDLAVERNQQELALARSIKGAVLPRVSDLTDGRKDFDFDITLVQADTVGGDFYDCLFVDDDHLLVVLGSIAEQGVPAALYMMRGLSIIRNDIGESEEPEELATKINYHICKGDSANIQVAMLIARIEISTGEVVCVNAGQHTPLLQRAGENFTEVPVPVAPVLGKKSNAEYTQYAFTMEPGDRLFACTSALTCMVNEEKELFGEQRLHQALCEAAPTIRDVPHLVRTAVRRFIQKAEREKDYTMVSFELPGLRRSGGSIVATAEEADKALQMIQNALEEVFAAPNDITNILNLTSTVLAAIPAGTQVRVVLGCTENHARVTLTYYGEERNILHSLPDLKTESASYHHVDNINDIILHYTLG